jgi:hypothetical protein
MSRLLTTAAVVAISVLPLMPAIAAGPYDGEWAVDFPAAGGGPGINSTPGCPAIRVTIFVNDNKVYASLEREQNSPLEVHNSSGTGGTAVSGTVSPDGSFTANWQGYTITGRLSGSAGEASTIGQCGPRTAHVVKVKDLPTEHPQR